MTLEEFQETFKKIGKLIYIAQLAEPMVTDLKRAHVSLVDQVATADGIDDSREFDLNDQIVTPFGVSIRKVAAEIDTIETKVKAAIQTYLQQFTAIDLGLAKGSALTAIGPTLAEQMDDAGATLAINSADEPNPTGFHAWFLDAFGFDLPTDDDPTIPDDWISGTVL